MKKENHIYDCLIIGCGPAGLSAALYGRRACLDIIILEKEAMGGKLNKTLSIENYPGYLDINGPGLAENMFRQVEELGVDHAYEEVLSIRRESNLWMVKTSSENSYRSKTILVTSGMKERVLDIPNVHEYYGKGVSYCAICDGNLYKNKKVVVVGGGNSAVEESMYLSKIVSSVDIVHRRREFRAEEISVKKMKEIENININVPYIPIEVTVKDDRVIGLTVENVETKERKLIEGACVFFYVGLIPENYFLNDLEIETSPDGFITVNEHMRTSIPSLFAAGDITKKDLRQVITAANDGAIAAISIKNYLESEMKD